MHFDVEAFDSVLNCRSYNFGRQGLTGNLTVYPFLVFKEKTNNLPKILIYNVDYLTFPEGKFPWMQNLPQIAPYIGDKVLRNRVLSNDEWFDTKEMYLPFYRYLGYTDDILEGLSSFCLNKKVSIDEQSKRGYHPLVSNGKSPNLDDMVNLRNFDVSKSNVQIVEEEVIRWAVEHNIKVLLVHAPMYCYNIHEQQVRSMDEYKNVIRNWVDKYDLIYLNYSHDVMSYDASYFVDLVHMNKDAAKKFTVRLANDLESLGIISNWDFN